MNEIENDINEIENNINKIDVITILLKNNEIETVKKKNYNIRNFIVSTNDVKDILKSIQKENNNDNYEIQYLLKFVIKIDMESLEESFNNINMKDTYDLSIIKTANIINTINMKYLNNNSEYFNNNSEYFNNINSLIVILRKKEKDYFIKKKHKKNNITKKNKTIQK